MYFSFPRHIFSAAYLILGNCQDINIMNVALNCWCSQCLNTRILTAKLYHIMLIIIQFTILNRTITRFTTDDKAVYQRVRWEMWLASDNSWALLHLSWRLRRFISRTLERRMPVSCEISRADRCLIEHKILHSYAMNVPLPGCRTIVPIFQILFSRLLMLPSFQPLLGNSLNSLHAPYCFDRKIFNQNCIFLWNFHNFVNFYWYLGLDSFRR